MPGSPDLSVIVPVRNGERFIATCLRSLQAQEIERERFELIVVDNGSTDRSVAIAREFGAEVLLAPKPGAGRARNVGIEAACAPVLAFTDVDCRVPADWLESALAAAEVSPIATGPIVALDAVEGFAPCRAALHASYLDDCRQLAAHGALDRFDSANLVLRREVLGDALRFDERVAYVEDREFAARLVEAGATISWTETLRVEHAYETELADSLGKARGTGRHWVGVLERCGDEFASRHYADIVEEWASVQRTPRLRLHAATLRHRWRARRASGDAAQLAAFAAATRAALRHGMAEAAA